MTQTSPPYGDEINPYQPPATELGAPTPDVHAVEVPPTGWSWAAFLWGWVWGIGNNTWIGLLCLIPYIGFVMKFVMGAKGKEWAWKNNTWRSVEHFNEVQRKWVIAWFVMVGAIAVVTLLIVALD